MNLADMLCYADIQQLSSIANTYDCECNGHSKNELIQSILSKVNRRDVFEREVGALSTENIRFLNSIVFDPRDLFSLEELVARAQQSNFGQTGEPRNPREMISGFKHRGWLFNGYSQTTKYLFQFPQDLKKRFKETMARSFGQQITYADVPSVYRDEQKLIVDDLFNMLHYIYHNEVVLTSDGSVYKRHLLQLLDRLAVKEEPVPKGGWRFGYGRKYRDLPGRLSLMYDYCYYHDLIAEQPGLLVLTDKGTQAVLEGRREDLSQVYRFWLKLYKGPIPNLQSIVFWIGKLATDWVGAQSLASALCPLIRPYYYDSAESIFDQRILQMTMHLGLIRIGEDEEIGKTIAFTKLGERIVSGTYLADEDAIPLPVPDRFDNPAFP
ncbi:hypothetical protein FE784_25040 [Paenibacillus hemerocallicola]|uniref:Helicase XPB/Ssl2 N-terminal domain-containing protein n=1 Tax=Paenibacillus hemerocallicola TaxID=1172614 RepID=A0A5C4T3D9_9BACL|nr:hypothetical protein [Paenibacillus hemerocallicola]TNJ63582.1 hypothetical protein FE784_25040 [Paenibacillus hemerocallicola]